MDPITILIAVGGGIAAVVGFGAGAAQIYDFIEKKLTDRQVGKKKLPSPVTGKVGISVGTPPRIYDELLGSLEWPKLCEEVFTDARGGMVLVVRTPFGGIRRLFADVAVRVLSTRKTSAQVVSTAKELVDVTSTRTSAVIIAEVTNAGDAEAWLNALASAQEGRSSRLQRRIRNKFIFMFAPPGPPIACPKAIEVREVNHSPAAASASEGLRNALVGSSNPIAFERECRNWKSSRPVDGAPPNSEPASVLRRFLQAWTDELERSGVNSRVDEAIASFLASIAIGMSKAPASLDRAVADQSIQSLFQANLQALLLATSSGGLAGIACEIAAARLFKLLRDGKKETRERILRATPIGCGDLPPWVRLICMEAERLAFDDVTRSDLASEVSGMLGQHDDPPGKHDFLGTNALFLGTMAHRNAVKDLRSAPLLWPTLDQRSYRGYKFDGSRILQPTLADSFGPVSALCWLGPDLVAFGTFTGELRIFSPSTGAIKYAERIDQNAISGLAVSSEQRTLLAVAYSGTVHRIDAVRFARVGSTISVGSRCRGVVFCPEERAFVLVTEAGELLRVERDFSGCNVIWRTSKRTRLKAICLAGDSRVCVGLDSGEIAFVDLPGGTARLVALGTAPIRGVAWSGSGASIAAVTDDGILQVCDPEGVSKGRVQVSEEKLWSVVFLPASYEIVVGGNAGSLRFFDSRTLIETRSASVHGSWIRCLLPSPDDDVIWSGGEDQSLCELNVRSMKLESKRIGAAPRIFAIREHDASVFLVGAGDGTLYCVDVDQPDEVKWTGSGHDDQVWCLDICAELGLVLTGSDDRKLGLWRLADGGLIGRLDCGQGWIGAVHIDQHTRSALAGDDNGYVYQFDLVSRSRVSETRVSHRRISAIIATSGGLHLAATEAGEVIALTVHAGGVRVEWTRQIGRGPLFSLAELKNGRIAAGGGDGAIYFFDARPKSRQARRDVSSGPIWSVSNSDREPGDTVIYCSDTGELGFASKQMHEVLYKRSAPIWTCTMVQEGRIAFGGEDGEILTLERKSGRLRTFQLPRAFSAASFVGVSGLTPAEKSVMAAAGARFT